MSLNDPASVLVDIEERFEADQKKKFCNRLLEVFDRIDDDELRGKMLGALNRYSSGRESKRVEEELRKIRDLKREVESRENDIQYMRGSFHYGME